MSGIWVRSQDKKKLCFCKGFEIQQTEVCKNKSYNIYGYLTDEIQPWLGKYSTEKWALKVLNEIQDCIDQYDKTQFYGAENANFVNPIFEMPAE